MEPVVEHKIEINGGKAQVKWEGKKLKAISIEFTTSLEVDPLMTQFDLRPLFANYFMGLTLIHKDSVQALSNMKTGIQSLQLERLPREIQALVGTSFDGDIKRKAVEFRKFKNQMGRAAKKQVLSTLEHTKAPISGKIAQVLKKSGDCACGDFNVLVKKKDGSHWWRCPRCRKEKRARQKDIVDGTVFMMIEENK